MKSSLFFILLSTLCFSSSYALCIDTERALLLKFKDSFAIDELASRDPSAYSKTDSWGRIGSDCCAWDGVECHIDTGRVIGLDLSSSFLYGSIGNNSSLFGLTHLQRLNLADNDFNFSRIPSSIDRLSKLTQLNLSSSFFSGQIPNGILSLSRLSSLDLNFNAEVATRTKLLHLKNPGFDSLMESLTSLRHLNLGYVVISGGMPESLVNSSSLEFLCLVFCELRGPIPSFIGKFQYLKHLDLAYNELSGQIPSSLANLTQLEYLAFASNDFETGNLSWLGSLTRLSCLSAFEASLTGQLPSYLGNLTRLVTLRLQDNQLSGRIPTSFARLLSLEEIILDGNNLSGEVDFDMFLSMKNLTQLQLSDNMLSVLIQRPNINETLPQFVWLGLGACNLIEFPGFLRHQKRIEQLILRDNQIGGNIPNWFWNMSTQDLWYLDLATNFLTGPFPAVLPFVNLNLFVVRNNSFTGSIPIPYPSILAYDASDNSFSGEIPTPLCNLQPEGTPQINRLQLINLRHNKLQGKLPHSLVNCTMLRYLNLEDNALDDTFPHWLGTLPILQLLILGSNGFHGEIAQPDENKSRFPQLRIIILSYNNFSGVLPSHYFQRWENMQEITRERSLRYANASVASGTWSFDMFFQGSIKIKGVNRQYNMINEELSIMDFSNNNFVGEIPETLGSLNGLRSLDLANNNLSSRIPSSLKNLTKLESLDLSANRLSGKIPQELTQLSFLQYFNVSYNRLVGQIPQTGQLNSFKSTSYEGNSGLCGIPLQNKCEAPEPEPSPYEEEQEDSSSLFDFGWKVVAIGYGCGFVVGVLIGKTAIARKPRLFSMIFRVRIFK